MIGELVAVRIDEVGEILTVTGMVAQQKNRRAAWQFKVTRGTQEGIPAEVEKQENLRKTGQRE